MAVLQTRFAVVLIVLVTLLAGIVPMGVHAQGGDDLAALRTQVGQLYRQGKYADAIPVTERYVESARRKHGEDHTEYATAISWLALVYKTQGRYAEAEPLYKRSLAIREGAGSRPPRCRPIAQQPRRFLLRAARLGARC